MKINGNFFVRNIYGTPYPRESQKYVSNAFGKDVMANAVLYETTKPRKWYDISKRINPEYAYVLIKRIMDDTDFIDVSRGEHDFIVKSIKKSKYDSYVKGQMLDLMYSDIDEREKPKKKTKKKVK